MKLKAKFILPTLALIIVGMSVTTWLTYRSSTQALSAVVLEKAKTNLSSLLALVEVWVDGIQNEVITLSRTDAVIATLAGAPEPGNAVAHALDLLRDSLSRHPNCDNIYIINAQGTVTTATNPNILGKDFNTRDYFQKAMQGKHCISNPIFAVDNNAAVFIIASPVKDKGKIVGVLCAGVQIGQFSKQFVEPLCNAAGHAFIAAPDGLTLSHPDGKLVGKCNLFNDTDYGKEIAFKPAGSLDVVSRGERRRILYETSRQTGWIVGMAVNTAVAFADARALGLLILGLSAGQAVVLAAGIWSILSLNVLRPVGTLVASAARIADGHLDEVLDRNRRDEIGALQRAMGTMVGNLKAKIGEADEKGRQAAAQAEKANQAMAEAEAARLHAERAKADGMLHAANKLTGVVEILTSASEQLSAQVEQSSRGSEDQSRRITDTATAMEEMNATVLEVAQNASHASRTADQAKAKAEEGARVVGLVVKEIEAVHQQARAMEDDMGTLGRQAEGIGQIINVISDIADQTNLLALNAAIEAARAGEAGRGFAVVADEVRKLAEKTMTATQEVGEAIRGIQDGTQKNIANVERTGKTIEEATRLASTSGASLLDIVALVESTTDQVRSIATASEEQSSASEEINQSIEAVSRLSSEMADAMRQSAQAVGELANQAQILNTLIQAMQAEAGAGQAPPSGAKALV